MITNTDIDYSNCIICIDDIINTDFIWTCPRCKIKLHKHCFDNWALRSGKSTCPHCLFQTIAPIYTPLIEIGEGDEEPHDYIIITNYREKCQTICVISVMGILLIIIIGYIIYSDIPLSNIIR